MHLTNQEIINKVTESPKKLKRQAKSLLYLLRKHEVSLDDDGNVDYSKCQNNNVVKTLRKQESLVKTTLMHADLEFEYPHKLERMMVQSRLLDYLDEEEAKIKRSVQDTVLLMDEEALMTGKTAKAVAVNQEQELTYEAYYQIDDFVADFGVKEKV